MNAFTTQYRCDDRYGDFKVSSPRTSDAGYFRFGENAICYGRTSAGFLRPDPGDALYDVLRDITIAGRNTALPFDADEIIDNLRYERYLEAGTKRGGLVLGLAKKSYYAFRRLMPVHFRKHLQRIYLRNWDRLTFPSWPVDRTVENIFEQLLILALQSHHVQKIPFIWFWPNGCSACSIITHDIDTEAGRNFSLRLADLDASFGVKSAFQIVPEERYEVPPSLLDALRARGCEVNLHGLNHDGRLFWERKEFLRRVERINRYAREYGAAGFRSPVLYRNLDWFGDLDFSYDMSVPNVAHLDPQRGGCCTVMPYFIGNLVELPLTTTQDYALFNFLGDRAIELWKRQIGLVTEKHGLVSFNIHPDYMLPDSRREVYRELLKYLVEMCSKQRIWLALPGEVDQWWRQRRDMRLIEEGGRLHVTGSSSERAVVAFASLKGGRIVYEVPDLTKEQWRSSA